MRPSSRTALLAAALAVPAAAAIPAASAVAEGLPTTFPRTIVITTTRQQVRVTRFEVTTRAERGRMRVTARVAARSLSGTRHLLLAVAPCTGGTLTSPLCVPRAIAGLNVTPRGLSAGSVVTRSFLVPRPAAGRDAVRITLTVGRRLADIPYASTHVGGGAGTAEILLNGGTWRFRSGTPWGLVARPAATSAAGIALDRVWFNSRRYEWIGATAAGATVTTTFGYEGAAPSWTFVNTIRPGVPFAFHRTPTRPLQDRRTVPRSFVYSAQAPAGRLFLVRVPLPAYAGR